MKTPSRLAALALLLVLIAGAAGGRAPSQEPPFVRPVLLSDHADWVVLEPAEPRAPAVAALAPEAADGLYSGRLGAEGPLVHLVWREDFSLGLVASSPPQWVVVEGGKLVPFVDPQDLFEPVDVEIEAPDAAASSAAGANDGNLQFFLVGDVPYGDAWGDLWDDYQLMVIHLMRAVYVPQLGADLEVVGQEVWSGDDPFAGAEICTTSPSVLGSFRNHYESTAPTTAADHEASHLFTARAFSTSVIGCAYVRQLETPWAYGVSKVAAGQLKPANLKRDVNLVSHELGHNFFGLHERAAPTPGGSANALGCAGPTTIMYPCLGAGNAGVFSETGALSGPLHELAVVRDGGNVPWMREYAAERL